jgi:hypothetical protein
MTLRLKQLGNVQDAKPHTHAPQICHLASLYVKLSYPHSLTWSRLHTEHPCMHAVAFLHILVYIIIHHHHHYTCFQPGSMRIKQHTYLGARQASHHQAVTDHYSPSKPGPVTALKANSTRIGYHK